MHMHMHTMCMCMCMCMFVVFRFDHARCGIYLLFAQNGPPSAASLVQHATTLSVVRATYTEMFTPGSNFFRGMVWYGPRRAYQGMVFRGGGYGPDRPRLAYHTPKQICQQAGGVVSRWSLDICTWTHTIPRKKSEPNRHICSTFSIDTERTQLHRLRHGKAYGRGVEDPAGLVPPVRGLHVSPWLPVRDQCLPCELLSGLCGRPRSPQHDDRLDLGSISARDEHLVAGRSANHLADRHSQHVRARPERDGANHRLLWLRPRCG